MKLAVVDTAWNYTLDSPYNEPLGGTQSAICYFLEEMASRGHEAYLFNGIEESKVIRGVTHMNSNKLFHYVKLNNIQLDIIIVSCIPTDLFNLKLQLNEPKTMFGLWTGHDIDQNASKLFNVAKLVDFIDLFIFVSDWQRQRFIDKFSIPYKKSLILRNGIGKTFEKYLNMPTNKIKNSMTYCSIPWRGLELLIPIFKKVKEHQSDASLKIFSGMNIYKLQEQPGLFDEFQKMDSVNCSYGVSQTNLADELYKIDYLSYPNTFQETSCITAIQAMACGCLVLTSNLGALKETMGGLNDYVDINIYDFDPTKYTVEFIVKQLKLMRLDDSEKEKLRELNREHIRKNYLYSVICAKFEKDMEPIFNTYKKYLDELPNNLQNFIKLFIDKNYKDCYNSSTQIVYHVELQNYYTIKLNQGVCLNFLGINDKALEYLKIARTVKDDFVVNKNIALIYLFLNNNDKFITWAKRALKYEFDILLASLIAEKYDGMNITHEAIGMYEAIINVEPDSINSLNNLGNLYLTSISNIPDFDEVMKKTYWKSLECAISKNEHRKKELILGNLIFNNLYNWKLTYEEIYERSRVWYKYFPKEANKLAIVNKLNRSKIQRDKLRIGYISTDFSTHPVGFMFDSILKNHNVNKFEIFCYDNTPKGKASNDIMSKKLRAYNNAKWFVIEDKSDEDILKQMVEDDLDILVDMMGHTRNTRMDILQYKPARIIVSYFAYPSTNGLDEIDYRFTDKYASPPSTQKYWVEKLYRLPNGFQCYTPPIDIESSKDYSRDKYKIHLCCFNNPIKLSKPTIETFAQVLKKLPEAKLFLRYCYYNSSFLKKKILKQFIDLGIEEERIDIDSLDLISALELYNKMDIVLDPFPYNGGTISSEAIYMNTPMITLAGSNYVSRVGVSLLSNLGLEKYIANTTDEYVQKVVDLANNPSELKELHQTLRIRMLNSDLANSVSFTHNVEAAYEDMVNKFNQK